MTELNTHVKFKKCHKQPAHKKKLVLTKNWVRNHTKRPLQPVRRWKNKFMTWTEFVKDAAKWSNRQGKCLVSQGINSVYDNSPSQKFYIGACEAVFEVRKGYRLATPTTISGSVKLDLISIV